MGKLQYASAFGLAAGSGAASASAMASAARLTLSQGAPGWLQ